MLAGEVGLSCGIVDYGALRNPLFLRLPPITGLRALRREVFDGVPEAKRNGFQIEIMINEVVVRRRAAERDPGARGPAAPLQDREAGAGARGSPPIWR